MKFVYFVTYKLYKFIANDGYANIVYETKQSLRSKRAINNMTREISEEASSDVVIMNIILLRKKHKIFRTKNNVRNAKYFEKRLTRIQ